MPGTDEQDFDEIAADLAQDAKQSFEQDREEQHDLLQDVGEEEGAILLETHCTIHGNTVPVSGRLNGELFDRFGTMEERLSRLENGDGSAVDVGKTARELSELLADTIDDPEFTAEGCYQTYVDHGIDPLGVILEGVFEALKAEEERQKGHAEGFRATS